MWQIRTGICLIFTSGHQRFLWKHLGCKYFYRIKHPLLEISRKLGDTREEHKRKLEERLNRKKKLFAERESKGLSTDDAILEALLEEEDDLIEKEEPKRTVGIFN